MTRPFTFSICIAQFRGDWISTAQYYAGDIIRYQNQIFLAIIKNKNSIPVDGTTWQLGFDSTSDRLVNYRADLCNLIDSDLCFYADGLDTDLSYIPDRTKFNNQGTIYGVTKSKGGILWQASTDYVNHGGDSSLCADSRNISIEVICQLSNPSGLDAAFLLHKYDQSVSALNAYWLRSSTTSNRLNFKFADNATYAYINSGSYPVFDGNLHHIICRVDRVNGMSIYVDGNLAGSNSQAFAGTAANQGSLYLGKRWSSSYGYLSGTIYRVMIYHRLFSTSEIASRHAHFDRYFPFYT
jgi:hypothetical protein